MAIRMPAPSRTRSMLGSASTRGSQSVTLGSPAVARPSDRGSFRFGTRTVAPNKPLHLTAAAAASSKVMARLPRRPASLLFGEGGFGLGAAQFTVLAVLVRAVFGHRPI